MLDYCARCNKQGEVKYVTYEQAWKSTTLKWWCFRETHYMRGCERICKSCVRNMLKTKPHRNRDSGIWYGKITVSHSDQKWCKQPVGQKG